MSLCLIPKVLYSNEGWRKREAVNQSNKIKEPNAKVVGSFVGAAVE